MFSKLLNRILYLKNVPQKILSIKTGFPKSTISKFTSGVQEPKYSQIVKILEALEVSPADFFSGDSNVQLEFRPIFSKSRILRPLLQDESKKFFVYSVLAQEDNYVNDLSLFMKEGITYIIYIQDGVFTFDSKDYHSGQFLIKTKGECINITHKVKKWTVYYAMAISEQPITLQDIFDPNGEFLI